MKFAPKYNPKSFIAVLLIFILAATVVGCKKIESKGPDEVWIQYNAFTPPTLTVPVNTTVQWTNKDYIPHTVTSNDTFLNSKNIVAGGSFLKRFATPGTYDYHCEFHGMTGKIIVE